MPIIAVMNKLKSLLDAQGDSANFLFISNKTIFNESIIRMGIPTRTIKAYKLRRYQAIQNITEIINLPIAFVQSLWHLFWFMPDVVFAKGGFVSLPVVLAAWVYQIPVIIHESDSVAGLANVISGKFSSKIAIAFNEAASYFSKKKVVLTGNPVREEILQGNKETAVEEFNLNNNLPTVLVMGGSQGAQKINETLMSVIPKIISKVQIIHISGIENYEELKKESVSWQMPHMENYHLYPFLFANLKDAYAISNLVISRAGANNIAEIMALAKPSILIPLSTSASEHQLKNAYFYANKGAAVLLEETNLSENLLYDAMFGILDNKEKQMRMVRSIRSIPSYDAAQLIAEEIIKLGK